MYHDRGSTQSKRNAVCERLATREETREGEGNVNKAHVAYTMSEMTAHWQHCEAGIGFCTPIKVPAMID
jgi:hypothetical protein